MSVTKDRFSDYDPYARLENLIRPKEASTNSYKELYTLIDKFRILSRMTWAEFILTAIGYYILEQNETLGKAILLYIDKRPKPGRPKNSGLKAKMREMGVLPEKDL